MAFSYISHGFCAKCIQGKNCTLLAAAGAGVFCCQHLKKVERIFHAPMVEVKCKGVVKLSASSVNYKGIIATHSIDDAKWYWFLDFIHTY